MIDPLIWLVTFAVALAALCYSVHVEFHNFRRTIFGFEIGKNRRVVAFGVLAIGAFCLFAPITWMQCFSSELGEGWGPGVLNLISWAVTDLFTVGWTTTIQTGLTDVTSTIYGAIQTGSDLGNQVLDLAYSILTLAYIIALPVEIGLFAFSAVTSRLSGFTIRRHLKRADHVIVFDGINANGELLVRDIIAGVKEGKLSKANGNSDISFIFCLDENEDGDRKQTLRSLCQGYASYVFSGEDMTDVISTVTAQADHAKHLSAIDAIFASEQPEHNVSAAIDALKALHNVTSHDGESPKITLHCIHDNSDDAQIFDAVKADHEPTCLHLMSRVQNEIYDALATAPLYSVLDSIDLSTDTDPDPQNLTVLIIGAGDYGMQAARTVYWMGRMPSIDLNIVVVDPDAQKILEREAARYPEMLSEQRQDGTPTMRFVETTVPSIEFSRLMAGCPISALHYDANNKSIAFDEKTTLLPDDARIYAFVTTGDCSQNLSCSLMLQRQIFNRYVDQGKPNYIKHSPVICPHVENEEILNALQSIDKTEGSVCIMRPFGSSKAFYTYSNIIDCEREQQAIQVNAAYELCYSGSIRDDFDATLPAGDAIESYNAKETNKSSSRASAAHVPYRFWALGFNRDDVKRESFEQDWKTKLQGQLDSASDNGNIVKAVLSSVVPSTATKEEFDANEQKNRERFNLVCRLGDMEHRRWLAYCQATGMTELGHGTADQERKQRRRAQSVDDFLNGKVSALSRDDSYGNEGTRKSDVLMRHAYMTPDNNVLGARGFLLGKDIFAYDRAIITLSARIAKKDIVQ